MIKTNNAITKNLLMHCDVKNNSEVRSPFGGVIGGTQLMLKLLVDGGVLKQPVIESLSNTIQVNTFSLEADGKVFLFTNKQPIAEDLELANLQFVGFSDFSGNYYDSNKLVIYNTGIFFKTKGQVGLYKCKGEVLKPYFSTKDSEPYGNIPIYLFT